MKPTFYVLFIGLWNCARNQKNRFWLWLIAQCAFAVVTFVLTPFLSFAGSVYVANGRTGDTPSEMNRVGTFTEMLDTPSQEASDSVGFRTSLDLGLKDEFLFTNVEFGYNPRTGDVYVYYWYTGLLTRFSESGKYDTLATVSFGQGEDPRRLLVSPDGTYIYFWPKGLGPVHRFDLSDRSIRRLDESKMYGIAHGHVSYLNEDGRLIVYGGYGYWEYRNLFLYFDPAAKGWFEMPSSGNVPDLTMAFALSYASDLDKYILIGFDDRANRIMGVWEYDVESAKWSKTARLQLTMRESEFSGPGHHFGTTKANAYDPETGYLVLSSKHLYDVRSRTIKSYQVEDAPRMITPLLFYSERWGSWVLFEQDYKPSTNVYIYGTVKLKELKTVSRPYINFRTQQLAPYGAILLILMVIAGVVLRRNRMGQEKVNSKGAPVVLIIQPVGNEEIQLKIRSEDVPLHDVHLKTLVEIITEMKQSNAARRPLNEVDRQLFSNISSSSYISKMKNKLIDLINEHAGKTILKVERSRIDKRYKVLTVDLDNIEIR